MTLVNPEPESRAPSSEAGEEHTEASDGAGFLPSQPPRRRPESLLVRLVATAGIVAIATAAGAVLSAVDVAGWVVALVVAVLSVVLAAVLWRSRVL